MSSATVTTLGRAAEVILGRQRAPQHDSGPHMVSYLRAANVKDGVLDLGDVKSMNFTPSEQAIFSLRPGDVLVTEGSGSLATVGASAVWNGEIPGIVCFQNTLLRLRPRSGTDGRYLAWWARAAFASGAFASVAGGANIYHLSAERLRTLPIRLPSLDEQRRIADFLDAETARLDRLVAARQRQAAALSERALATITEAFRGLGALEIRLGYLARVQSGLTVDGSRELTGDVVTRPYLRVANVQSGYLDLENVAEITVPRGLAAGATLRPGDVLMTEGGDLDKLGRGTVWDGQLPGCLHQNHVFAVRPSPDRLLPDYLALYTRSVPARMHFERTGTKTTNLASTSSSKIKGLKIPLVPLHVQRELCDRITTELASAEKLVSVVSAQLDLIAERKQALITAAVTGQFDVTTAGRDVRELVVP